MCRIEVYDLHFPDGHVETRKQLLNTCRYAQPYTTPCRHREVVHLFRTRLATWADIEDRAQREAITMSLAPPRRTVPVAPDPPKRKMQLVSKPGSRHRSVLDELRLAWKIWSPSGFTAHRRGRSDDLDEQIVTIEPRRHRRNSCPPGAISLVQHHARAPSPPPAWMPDYRRTFEPQIMDSRVRPSPQRSYASRSPSAYGSHEPHPPQNLPRQRHRRPNPSVVIHQSPPNSSSSRSTHSTTSSSSSKTLRSNERPQGSSPQAPSSFHNETDLDRERLARRTAYPPHPLRRHQYDNYNRDRISLRERHHLESAEGQARRRRQESIDRAARAQHEQERLDRLALSRRQPRCYGPQTPPSPRYTTQFDRAPATRSPGVNSHIGRVGDNYLQGAMETSRREGGVCRRNTIDGSMGIYPGQGRGRGHVRWRGVGGSG